MIVFVDGENFRQNLSLELVRQHLIKNRDVAYKYDVVGLMREALMVDDPDIWYYASEVKLPKGHEVDDQVLKQVIKIEKKTRRWVPMLKEQGIKYIKAGNLKVKMSKPCRHCGESSEIIQEKGVDVRMALDIFEQSLNPSVEEIAVMSSDVDICPVYQKIRKHWTKVRYVCFADRMNMAINSACYKTMKISPRMVKNHFDGVMLGGEVELFPDDLAIDDYIDEN